MPTSDRLKITDSNWDSHSCCPGSVQQLGHLWLCPHVSYRISMCVTSTVITLFTSFGFKSLLYHRESMTSYHPDSHNILRPAGACRLLSTPIHKDTHMHVPVYVCWRRAFACGCVCVMCVCVTVCSWLCVCVCVLDCLSDPNLCLRSPTWSQRGRACVRSWGRSSSSTSPWWWAR